MTPTTLQIFEANSSFLKSVKDCFIAGIDQYSLCGVIDEIYANVEKAGETGLNGGDVKTASVSGATGTTERTELDEAIEQLDTDKQNKSYPDFSKLVSWKTVDRVLDNDGCKSTEYFELHAFASHIVDTCYNLTNTRSSWSKRRLDVLRSTYIYRIKCFIEIAFPKGMQTKTTNSVMTTPCIYQSPVVDKMIHVNSATWIVNVLLIQYIHGIRKPWSLMRQMTLDSQLIPSELLYTECSRGLRMRSVRQMFRQQAGTCVAVTRSAISGGISNTLLERSILLICRDLMTLIPDLCASQLFEHLANKIASLTPKEKKALQDRAQLEVYPEFNHDFKLV